jgi:hypothetical protein
MAVLEDFNRWLGKLKNDSIRLTIRFMVLSWLERRGENKFIKKLPRIMKLLKNLNGD